MNEDTIDGPEVITTPDVEAQTTPDQDITPDPVSDDAADSTEDSQDGSKEPSRAEKRIQQLVGDRNAAYEFGKLQQEHSATLQRQLDARDKPAEAKAPTSPVMPKRQDFDYDDDAFDAAMANYTQQTIATTVAETVSKAMETTGQKTAAEQADIDWNANVAEFSKDHEDFGQVAFATTPIYNAIKALEDGPAIAYHLGQNPAEAQRIAALPSDAMAFELGRVNVSAKPPVAQKQVTKAPDPMSPVSGQQPNISDANLTIDDYMVEWRARQAAKRAR